MLDAGYYINQVIRWVMQIHEPEKLILTFKAVILTKSGKNEDFTSPGDVTASKYTYRPLFPVYIKCDIFIKFMTYKYNIEVSVRFQELDMLCII